MKKIKFGYEEAHGTGIMFPAIEISEEDGSDKQKHYLSHDDLLELSKWLIEIGTTKIKNRIERK